METELSMQDSFSLPSFWRGAIGLFRGPKTLLRSMSKEGGYGKPIVYALLWQYVAGAVGLLLSLIRPASVPLGVAGKVALFFLMPPLTILLGFVFAGIFFVVWHLMGSSHNYQTAFRFWALLAPLAVASAVLSVVPFANLVVTVFYFFLLVTASVEIHSIRPTKAWTVWGILFAVFALVVLVGGILGAARGKMLSSRPDATIGGFPSSSGFPTTPPPFNGQGAMTPETFQKNNEAEMALMKAESERARNKPQLPSPPQKKAPVKK
jgi:hypothetical protein